MESNADQSTTCFQNFPIPPCALAKPDLPKTALCACWKINGDHLARLVSSNWEDFAHYQYNEFKKKKRYSSTRGNLWCLLGFRPMGGNPSGAVSARMSWSISEILKLFKKLAVVYYRVSKLSASTEFLNLIIHSSSFFLKSTFNLVTGSTMLSEIRKRSWGGRV